MKWKTKSGDIIDVQEMDDAHLDNCIKLIRKRIRDGEAGGRGVEGSKKTLVGLFQERSRRNENAFAVDMTDMDEKTIQDELELIFDETRSVPKRPKTFLEKLGEL